MLQKSKRVIKCYVSDMSNKHATYARFSVFIIDYNHLTNRFVASNHDTWAYVVPISHTNILLRIPNYYDL